MRVSHEEEEKVPLHYALRGVGTLTLEAFADVRRKMALGDVVMFFFIVAFVRQYLWVVEDNASAWYLTLPVSFIAWFFYVATREDPAEKTKLPFWVVVALPLLLVYALRVAFPDLSFDVLSYRLFHGERSLRGPLLQAGDFFPTAVPLNPVADMAQGIFRHLFGYRLGTLVNLLALVWAGQIVDRILHKLIAGAWPRAVCVLLVLFAEHVLFEISTYMVDLLALPLMLEATYLTLRANEAKNRRLNLVHIAFLLGASAAFKFTNLAAVVPLIFICTYKALRYGWFSRTQLLTTAMLALIAFVAPLLPFSIYIYSLTGNPVFPIANVFFKSPYWPTHGGWDARWGPHNFWETLIWPVLSWLKPERHSELAVYSGRLALGFIVAIVGLMVAWRNVTVRTLCFVSLASSLLWSAAGMGYSRYGLYQEMLAGITAFAVAATLAGDVFKSSFSWKTAVAAIICVVLLGQTVMACQYVRHKEWGGRTTLIADGRSYAREAKFMLRDRNLASYLSDEQHAVLDGVHVWLETCPQSTAFEALLKPQAPIIAARQPEYFFTRESRRQFVRKVEELPGEKMFSLCMKEYLTPAQQAIATRGLQVGRVIPLDLAFFSPDNRIGLILIEVLRPVDSEARQKFQSSWMNAAFPDSDYREQIVALNAPSAMRPGEKVTVRFKIKNLGYSTWPAIGNKEGRYQVNLRNRWLNAAGNGEVNSLDGGTAMQADLAPGKEAELPLTITAPSAAGQYIVEVDMVHEGVTWFYERGATPLRLRVRIEP